MSTIQVPINDLLSFIKEEIISFKENKKTVSRDILALIDKHYFSLTNYHIKPIAANLAMTDFCFGDIYYDKQTRPELPGMLVENSSHALGITVYTAAPDEAINRGRLSVVSINNHKLTISPYHTEVYNIVGMMTRFYKYPGYDSNADLPLGGRLIKLQDNGIDVIEIQQILKNHVKDISITGVFDEQTQKAYLTAAKDFGLPQSDYYNPKVDKVLFKICEMIK